MFDKCKKCGKRYFLKASALICAVNDYENERSNLEILMKASRRISMDIRTRREKEENERRRRSNSGSSSRSSSTSNMITDSVIYSGAYDSYSSSSSSSSYDSGSSCDSSSSSSSSCD